MSSSSETPHETFEGANASVHQNWGTFATLIHDQYTLFVLIGTASFGGYFGIPWTVDIWNLDVLMSKARRRELTMFPDIIPQA